MAETKLLEQRVAETLSVAGAKAEAMKMFGGVAFMVRGHMSVGISNKGDFMARFDPARHAEILEWPGAKPMTFGKPGMKGFLFVDPGAVADRRSLDRWVRLSLQHIGRFPAKEAKAVKKPAAAKTAKKTKPAKR